MDSVSVHMEYHGAQAVVIGVRELFALNSCGFEKDSSASFFVPLEGFLGFANRSCGGNGAGAIGVYSEGLTIAGQGNSNAVAIYSFESIGSLDCSGVDIRSV